MTFEEKAEAVAAAEDTYDLMQHIGWTNIIKPKLEEQLKLYSEMLVTEALGTPLPQGLTREQIAGKAFGIKYISNLLEKILRDGKRALEDLQATGFHLT